MFKENFMTFNLKYDFTKSGDSSWENRCDKIVKIIKDNNPICVGTQEGLNHMLLSMDSKLDDYSYFGEGREGEKQGEFNAIFYKKDKLELLEWNQFWLSETPEVVKSTSWGTACERICTYGKFKDKSSNEIIRVYNTHLDHVSELARVEGLKLILKKAKENYLKDAVAFIIMGDFNCNSDDKAFDSIREEEKKEFKVFNLYEKVNHNIIGTFHNFTGIYEEGIIDYILVSKELSCEKLWSDERVIDGGYPSDHYPVIATLELLKE